MPRLIALATAALLLLASTATSLAAPLDPLGAYDPGTTGLNASVAGLDGYAYLGSWASASLCSNLGVRVVDVHDPAAPRPMAPVMTYPRMTVEHVIAQPMRTPAFSGNVLLAGTQRCAGNAPGGLALWDVTDPANARELGYFEVGRAARGVHEFAVSQRGDRWYAYLAVPNAEVMGSGGDLVVVDVTDPTQPVEVTDWGARKEAGLRVGFGRDCAPDCRGAIPQAFLHSVALSPDGRTAYLSYWDLGVLILDVSDPAAPRYLGRFAEPAAAEGNTHSVSLTRDGSLMLVGDETFSPPWGRLRLVDVRDPTNTVEVGTYDTLDSAAGRVGNDLTWYGIHNPLVDDRDPSHAYLAWYSDGVRLLDISNPAAPAELASWVPPHDALVWNVAPLGDVLLVADVNAGLYILQR